MKDKKENWMERLERLDTTDDGKVVIPGLENEVDQKQSETESLRNKLNEMLSSFSAEELKLMRDAGLIEPPKKETLRLQIPKESPPKITDLKLSLREQPSKLDSEAERHVIKNVNRIISQIHTISIDRKQKTRIFYEDKDGIPQYTNAQILEVNADTAEMFFTVSLYGGDTEWLVKSHGERVIVSFPESVKTQFSIFSIKQGISSDGISCLVTAIPKAIYRFQFREYFRMKIPRKHRINCIFPDIQSEDSKSKQPVKKAAPKKPKLAFGVRAATFGERLPPGTLAKTADTKPVVPEENKAVELPVGEWLEVFDISAGGLSLKIPEAHVGIFQVSAAYPNVTLNFDLEELEPIQLTLIVRNVIPVTGYDDYAARVGCEFAAINLTKQNTIQKYISMLEIEEREKRKNLD